MWADKRRDLHVYSSGIRGTDLRVSSYDYLAGVSYFVECFDCCEGPWHTTKVGAVNI